MNKQITEDYVSYEIAKLLKEKGFKTATHAYYDYDGNINVTPDAYIPKGYNTLTSFLLCPTFQMTLKWLREVHNIHISINVGCDVDNKNYIFYTPTIVKLNNKSVEYIDPFCEDEDEFDSNEKAIETALLYVLKNLI